MGVWQEFQNLRQNNYMNTGVTITITEELNKTGLFLETIVFTSLLRHPEFKVRREEPYSGFTSEGFEGTIDVLAISKIHDGLLICIPIECKKADPKQKHWVFEVRKTEEEPTFPFEYYEAGIQKPNYQKNIFFPSLGYDGMKFFDKAIESFEFNESTGKLNRNTQLGRPYDAMKQSNEAVSSFVDEKRKRIFEIAGVNVNQTDILYIPLVVTTANLYTLEYEAKEIDWVKGEVLADKLKMNEKGWVHFEFPLPYSLITRTQGGLGPVKRPSFIVNSNKFQTFILDLIEDCKQYILDSA